MGMRRWHTVCDDADDDDDDDVTVTNGEVSNADDDSACNVTDLFDLFKWLYCNNLNV